VNARTLISWTAISLIIHTAILSLPRWSGNNQPFTKPTLPVEIVYGVASALPFARQSGHPIAPHDLSSKARPSHHPASSASKRSANAFVPQPKPVPIQQQRKAVLAPQKTEPLRIAHNVGPIPPAASNPAERHPKSGKTSSDNLSTDKTETLTAIGSDPPPSPMLSAETSPFVEAVTPPIPAPTERTVIPPRYDVNPLPDYPAVALKRRWQGEVSLRALIGKQGEVLGVSINSSSGHDILDNAALNTVRHWKFHPARNGNENVQREVLCPIRFTLPRS